MGKPHLCVRYGNWAVITDAPEGQFVTAGLTWAQAKWHARSMAVAIVLQQAFNRIRERR